VAQAEELRGTTKAAPARLMDSQNYPDLLAVGRIGLRYQACTFAINGCGLCRVDSDTEEGME
jgi:hypothetical protein